MNDPLIKKKTLHAGTANVSEFPLDTKVCFSFNYKLIGRFNRKLTNFFLGEISFRRTKHNQRF
jgi:hypothetical protein